MTNSNTNRLAHGTAVTLPDGTAALAYRDCAVGRPWDGVTYRCVQRNPATGGTRVDLYPRDQLAVT